MNKLVAWTWLLCALPAAAQTRLGESCDLAVLGQRDTAAFMRFDQALRDAVHRRDAPALQRLLQFPLALNRGERRSALADGAAWQGQFSDAWWPLLQQAVSAQPPEQLFCNAEGVMYGNGTLWAGPDGQRVRVRTINLPKEAAAVGPSRARSALLSCSTGKHRIEIDAAPDGTPRYRCWNEPHAPPEAPAVDLTGQVDAEGTGSCARRSWRFDSGHVRYVVSEPGCSDASVPAGAKARLSVDIAGRRALDAWCR